MMACGCVESCRWILSDYAGPFYALTTQAPIRTFHRFSWLHTLIVLSKPQFFFAFLKSLFSQWDTLRNKWAESDWLRGVLLKYNYMHKMGLMCRNNDRFRHATLISTYWVCNRNYPGQAPAHPRPLRARSRGKQKGRTLLWNVPHLTQGTDSCEAQEVVWCGGGLACVIRCCPRYYGFWCQKQPRQDFIARLDYFYSKIPKRPIRFSKCAFVMVWERHRWYWSARLKLASFSTCLFLTIAVINTKM